MVENIELENHPWVSTLALMSATLFKPVGYIPTLLLSWMCFDLGGWMPGLLGLLASLMIYLPVASSVIVQSKDEDGTLDAYVKTVFDDCTIPKWLLKKFTN